MCKFCEKIAFSDDEYMQRRYVGGDFIYHDEKGYGILIDTGDSGCLGSLSNVSFCPVCGRDLMNENRENCEYLSLETIKSIYEKNVNMAKCKYAVCDYYDGKNVYCITDDLSEAEFECFVKIDHPGNVVYDLEKDEVVWEVKDLGLDDKTLELVTKLKRSWQTNE